MIDHAWAAGFHEDITKKLLAGEILVEVEHVPNAFLKVRKHTTRRRG